MNFYLVIHRSKCLVLNLINIKSSDVDLDKAVYVYFIIYFKTTLPKNYSEIITTFSVIIKNNFVFSFLKENY